MDADLEAQRPENPSSQPGAPNQEQQFSDAGQSFSINAIGEREMDPMETILPHFVDQGANRYGTTEYYQHLVQITMKDCQTDNYALSFDLLHRLVLLDHQKKLASHFRDITSGSKTTTNANLLDIGHSLHEYTKATADYMFWREKYRILPDTKLENISPKNLEVKSGSEANFQDFSELCRSFLPEIHEIQDLTPEPPYAAHQPKFPKDPLKANHAVKLASTVDVLNYVPYRWLRSDTDRKQNEMLELSNGRLGSTAQVLNHFAMAIVGGISLIVPMLIMALHRSRATTLVTTSVAVTLFAVVLSLWPILASRFPWVSGETSLEGANEALGNKDLLLATAAYAAVLVVFVGAGLSTVE